MKPQRRITPKSPNKPPQMQAVRRYRPTELQVKPPRRIPWGTLMFLALTAAAVFGWLHLRPGPSAGAPYELVLKSSDKGIETKQYFVSRVLDEGTAVSSGAGVETRKSEKVCFSFGPSSSLRLGAGTILTLTANGTADKKASATLTVETGRLWLVQGKDVQWRVETPICSVYPRGRVTEVKVSGKGDTLVLAWQGSAELVPRDAQESRTTIPEGQQASFATDGTLVQPHDYGLTTGDAWLSWNLLETMQKVIKPAAQ